MGKLIDTLFGGKDDSGQQAQQDANAAALALQEKLAAQARGDAMGLFGESRESAQGGFQGALDILGQTKPQQANMFQGGNVAAQNTLLAGLPQMQAAIMGQPIDLSGLQAQSIPFDPSMMQRTLPARSVEENQQSAGAFPQGVAAPGASPNELNALLNLGVTDIDANGRVSNEEFRNWSGYTDWLSGKYGQQLDRAGNPIPADELARRLAG